MTHVVAHEPGAAAYAIKAARAPTFERQSEDAGRTECRWQREQFPDAIRELVLEDPRLRNEICRSVFDGGSINDASLRGAAHSRAQLLQLKIQKSSEESMT